LSHFENGSKKKGLKTPFFFCSELQDFCVAVNYTSTDAGTFTFFFFLLLLLCSFEVI
jgi:hypothetical protein